MVVRPELCRDLERELSATELLAEAMADALKALADAKPRTGLQPGAFNFVIHNVRGADVEAAREALSAWTNRKER
jgi:hypothetical protein